MDLILILVILGLALFGIFTFKLTQGSRAVVYVANKKFAWYDLTMQKKTYAIPTRIGEIEIEIGNGIARVLHAPCPNQLCIKTDAIKHSHEEIVCMPGQLLIEIEGNTETNGNKAQTDAITY